MYIVAIAWIYVVLLMALTEASFVAGMATFFFYGLGPLAILLYLMGTPQRRRNRRRREAHQEQEAVAGAEAAPAAQDTHPAGSAAGEATAQRDR